MRNQSWGFKDMTGMDLRARFDRVMPVLMERVGERRGIEAGRDMGLERMRILTERKDFLDRCGKVIQAVSEAKKKEITEKIESLVTAGLRAIFEREDYGFGIEMELKRGAMTARPVLRSMFGGEEMTSDVMEGHGGGLVDVVAFVLQVVVLLAVAKDQDLARLIIADEPFKHVSREYLSNVAEFLDRLKQVTGLQFMMVTHKPEFTEMAERDFTVFLNKDGETVIK